MFYGVRAGSAAGLCATAAGDCVGVGDWVGVGRIGGPLGEIVGVIPGEAELLGLADEDGEVVGVALPCGVPP